MRRRETRRPTGNEARLAFVIGWRELARYRPGRGGVANVRRLFPRARSLGLRPRRRSCIRAHTKPLLVGYSLFLGNRAWHPNFSPFSATSGRRICSSHLEAAMPVHISGCVVHVFSSSANS
ncbi:hypothetical protein C8Q78DRAFT_315948 [Trametes maxima]|nr:hypothetical protein C8Q78DRAFT_315948 [Trametes maxima]